MTSRQLSLFSDHSDSASYDVTSPAVPAEENVTTPAAEPVASAQNLPGAIAKPRPANKPTRKRANKPRKPQQTSTVVPVVMRVGDVAQRYSTSIPTVWRWVKEENGFPAPVRIGPGTTRWYIADLDAFDALRRRVAVKGARQ